MGIYTGAIPRIAYENISADYLLETMIESHGDALLRYCHGILLDYHEAQDVVQSTFIKAYAKISTPGATETHGAWLYKTAYTACIDILRRKKLQNLFFVKTGVEETTTPEYFTDENVNAVLSELPPKDRALVYSRAVEGLDYAELVTIYGTNAATLRKRYERAKNKLAKAMKSSGIYEGSADHEK